MKLKINKPVTDPATEQRTILIELDPDGLARWENMSMTKMIYDVFEYEDEFTGGIYEENTD
jgi:hypothetical protein